MGFKSIETLYRSATLEIYNGFRVDGTSYMDPHLKSLLGVVPSTLRKCHPSGTP